MRYSPLALSFALLASAMLSAGCCCMTPAASVGGCQSCQQGHAGGHTGHRPLHQHRAHAPAAAETAFTTPLPKFHPVPTRPVFEPAPEPLSPLGLQLHAGEPRLAPLPSRQ